MSDLSDTGDGHVTETPHDLKTLRIMSTWGRALCALYLCGCQLIGPLERELSGPEEEVEGEGASPTCLLTGASGEPWWVGAWEVDGEHMKVQLFERLSNEAPSAQNATQQGGRTDTITNVFIASISQHFELQVTHQQASVRREGSWRRFPISQLPRQAGVRLTSLEPNESSTLWCQGDHAYWSAEGGSPLPLKRISTPMEVTQ